MLPVEPQIGRIVGATRLQVGAATTVMVNEQEVLLQASLEVQVTVVVPTGNVVPEAGTQVVVGEHPPLTPGVQVCVRWQYPTVRFAGQVRVMFGEFGTVKVEAQVRVASQEDVTVYVTVVDPPQRFGATGVP